MGYSLGALYKVHFYSPICNDSRKLPLSFISENLKILKAYPIKSTLLPDSELCNGPSVIKLNDRTLATTGRLCCTCIGRATLVYMHTDFVFAFGFNCPTFSTSEFTVARRLMVTLLPTIGYTNIQYVFIWLLAPGDCIWNANVGRREVAFYFGFGFGLPVPTLSFRCPREPDCLVSLLPPWVLSLPAPTHLKFNYLQYNLVVVGILLEKNFFRGRKL